MENRKHRLKIVFGDTQSRVEQHAKKTILAIEENQFKQTYAIMPMHLPIHLVQYPLRCDDCGESYWSRDAYGAHIGCKGVPSKGRGMGFLDA